MDITPETCTELVLARFILRLKDWSYDLFSEGDYSNEMSELVEWAKKKVEEYEKTEA